MLKESSEAFHEKAIDAYKSIPKEEVRAWAKHPITRSLIYSLYGDIAGHFEGWMAGDFTGASSDETTQKNAKALGNASAIKDVLAWIEDAEEGDLYD